MMIEMCPRLCLCHPASGMLGEVHLSSHTFSFLVVCPSLFFFWIFHDFLFASPGFVFLLLLVLDHPLPPHVFCLLFFLFESSSFWLLELLSLSFTLCEGLAPSLSESFPSLVLPVKTACQTRNLRPFRQNASSFKLPCFLNADSHCIGICYLVSLLLHLLLFLLLLPMNALPSLPSFSCPSICDSIRDWFLSVLFFGQMYLQNDDGGCRSLDWLMAEQSLMEKSSLLMSFYALHRLSLKFSFSWFKFLFIHLHNILFFGSSSLSTL